MQITTQIKLLQAKEQLTMINNTMQEYINAVNSIVDSYVSTDNTIKYTSKTIIANLPSALKNQDTGVVTFKIYDDGWTIYNN